MLHHDYYLHRVEEKYFRDLSDLRKNKRREGKKKCFLAISSGNRVALPKP